MVLVGRQAMKKTRPRPPASAFAARLMPSSYEKLVAQLKREYPEYTLAEIEAAIVEAARTPSNPTPTRTDPKERRSAWTNSSS